MGVDAERVLGVAHARERRKEIRTNPLESLDTRSGKQRVAARGKAISATGTGSPPTAVAFGKGARHMCSLYVPIKPAVPIEETGRQVMSSRPEDSHLRALPDPYVNLSIHTAPDVRPFPWQSCQWAKSVGFARRSRSNQSRAPLVFRRNRLNLRRAQRMT